MDDEAILDLVRRAAWENQYLELNDISMGSTIGELGVESITMAQIVGELEDELGVRFPDEKVAEARGWTVRQLLDFLHGLSA